MDNDDEKICWIIFLTFKFTVMKKFIFIPIIFCMFFVSHSVSAQTINCDSKPFVPPGFSVAEHQKGGQLEFDPQKVSLFLSENQKNGKSITASDLQKEIVGKTVLNADVLDFLLAHPKLIPEEWAGKCVLFMGTIYNDKGHLCVRFLIGETWGCVWLEGDLYSRFPVAIVI